MNSVLIHQENGVAVVTINRPEVRKAVDGATAQELAEAFRKFDLDENLKIAVLTGAGGTFCAGADLKAIAAGQGNRMSEEGDGPMGPTRMLLTKPVIAAVEGHAVAGGLELALWCDLRVAARDAVFGVYCRRFGVPLVDLGLANRLVEPGRAREASIEIARELARLPQGCLRLDRMSAYEQWPLGWADAIRNEFLRGMEVVESGETRVGAQRFSEGTGRHGNTG